MTRPCVMDIKAGRLNSPPGATKKQIAAKAESCTGTKIPYGFSVQGIILNTDQGVTKLTKKEYGQSLDATTVHTILENYLVNKNARSLSLAKSFLKRVCEIEKFFETQTAFHNFGCSFLFVYDYDDETSAKVHLIDFAHAFPGNGKIDSQHFFALTNIRKLFQEFIADDNNNNE